MSFFNKSRVQKRRAPASAPSLSRAASSPSASSSRQATANTTTPLRRTNTSSTTPTLRKDSSTTKSVPAEDDDDYFLSFQLDDVGLPSALASDPSLRDVPQALRYIRQHMFDPMPVGGSGMSSTRISEVLRFRARIPPVAGVAHVATLLAAAATSRWGGRGGAVRGGSHTATEREIDDLIRNGIVTRVLVPTRGTTGEVLIEVAEIEKLLNRALASASSNTSGITEPIIRDFLTWIKDKHTGARLPKAGTDPLVRSGFLTSHGFGGGSVFARPEDRFSHVSLDAVSRAASGSVAAVGGDGALDRAGGSGGGRGDDEGAHATLTLAVPGMGPYLKLATGALAHLRALLAKAPFKEAPEDLLRERWDGGPGGGGGLGERAERMAARGEYFGVLPGRTKKWKEFYGLGFDWLLAEAVSTGLVELFETGSVGRGVRLVG